MPANVQVDSKNAHQWWRCTIPNKTKIEQQQQQKEGWNLSKNLFKFRGYFFAIKHSQATNLSCFSTQFWCVAFFLRSFTFVWCCIFSLIASNASSSSFFFVWLNCWMKWLKCCVLNVLPHHPKLKSLIPRLFSVHFGASLWFAFHFILYNKNSYWMTRIHWANVSMRTKRFISCSHPWNQ